MKMAPIGRIREYGCVLEGVSLKGGGFEVSKAHARSSLTQYHASLPATMLSAMMIMKPYQDPQLNAFFSKLPCSWCLFTAIGQ